MRKKIDDVRSVTAPVQPNAAAARLLNDVLEEGGADSVLAAATTAARRRDPAIASAKLAYEQGW